MAVNSLTMFYSTFGWITTLFNLILIGALLIRFLQKKTTGTLLLFFAYVFVGVTSILAALVYNLEVAGVSLSTQTLLQMIASIAPLLSLTLIYIFSCRHILRDNELLKTLHTIVISIVVGFGLTLFVLGAFNITPQFTNFIVPEGEKASWWQIKRVPITGTTLYNFSITAISPPVILSQIYINLRVGIRSFVLAKRTSKAVRKRGLQLIGWGLITYLLAGVIITLEISIHWPVGSAMPPILWALRKLGFVVAYIILYLGWIMPEWLRRRIRGKTWFEMQYKNVRVS